MYLDFLPQSEISYLEQRRREEEERRRQQQAYIPTGGPETFARAQPVQPVQDRWQELTQARYTPTGGPETFASPQIRPIMPESQAFTRPESIVPSDNFPRPSEDTGSMWYGQVPGLRRPMLAPVNYESTMGGDIARAGSALGTMATRSIIPRPIIEPVLNAVERVPIAGPTLRNTVEFGTSPLALAPLGFGAAGARFVGAGLAGQAAGGTIGGGLEEAGVPYARPVGEVVGGLATPGMITAPGRAVRGAFSRGLERRGGVRGLTQEALTGEAGGTRIGEEWSQRAGKTFDKNTTPRNARYILEDGTIVGDAASHGLIADVASGYKAKGSLFERTNSFIKETGAVRVYPSVTGHGFTIETMSHPTPAQRLALNGLVEGRGKIVVDVTDPATYATVKSAELHTPNELAYFFNDLKSNPPRALQEALGTPPEFTPEMTVADRLAASRAYKTEVQPENILDEMAQYRRGTMPAETPLTTEVPSANRMVGVGATEPGAPIGGGGGIGGVGGNAVPDSGLSPSGLGRALGLPEGNIPQPEGATSAAGRPLRHGLDNLVEDAEQAAKDGGDLPPPPGRPTETGGFEGAQPSRTIPFPRPSTLHTVEEIAADVRRSTQNFVGATTRVAGKVPPIKSILETVNPSAFYNDPPSELITELGKTKAQRLMSDLGAYHRKIEQANAQLGATSDAIRQQARAVGLRVKDARVVNVEGQPFVGDLFENPSRYKLTPAQKQFADDVDGLLKDMARTERAAGVKRGEIFSEEGRYFPRSVQSVEGIDSIRGPVRQNVGATQGFQKERFYESMAEGNENGVNYRGDIAALVTTRLRAGLKAVSDKEIEKLLGPLGRFPTEEAPARFGEMGTTLSGLGSEVFPQNTAQRIMEALTAKGAPPGLLAPARIINAIMVPLRATGDLSLTLLQALPTAFRNPVAFFKAVGYELDGLLLDGRMYGSYVQNNARWVERFVAAGGELRGSEMTFSGNINGQWMRRIMAPTKPLTSRFDAAFTNGANVAALENFKAMVGVGDSMGSNFLKRAGQIAFGNVTGQESDEIAASIASKMTGRMSTRALGVSQAQQLAESILMFAPKFYRATFGLVGDAVQGGMRGAEARRVLGSLIAGAGATYAGVSAALGQTPKWDPRKSDFLTVEVKGQRMGFGGPLHGMIRAVAKAMDDPSKLDNFNMSNPLVSWARGRSSPVVGILTDMVTGKDFLGKPMPSSPEGIAKQIGLSALPFAAQTAIKEGLPSALATGTGLRSFPISPSQRRNELSQEKFGKDYLELDVDQRQQIDPEVRDLSSQIDEGQRERGDTFQKTQDYVTTQRAAIQAEQAADDAAAESGAMDIEQWKDNYRLRQARMAGISEGAYGASGVTFDEKSNLPPIRAALEKYFGINPDTYMDPTTREVDWDKFFAAREQSLAGLDESQRAAAQAEIEKNLTPFAKRFRDASALRREAPAKYRGMSKESEERYYDFQKQITDRRDELFQQTGHTYTEKRVAFMLAKETGDMEMWKWYKFLSSQKRRERYTSPDYDQYLQENEDTLEPFYPKLYTTAVKRRWAKLRRRKAA